MQDKIIDALRRNAVEEAFIQARDWVQLQPDDPRAHRWLAVASQQRGEHADALLSIDRAIALDPQDDSLQLVRASLLIAGRQLQDASAALDLASGLNPNQLSAYLMQAQLALARGDMTEAERQNRLAARVSPEHPQLAVVESMLALQRGDADTALRLVSAALQKAPDDMQLRYALAHSHMRKGYWAFAEQAFRSVAEKMPGATHLRLLISELVARQGRPDAAADELAPLLADPQVATPVMQRAAGVLRLHAGQPERALPLLKSALAGMPGDLPTLQALVGTWRELDLASEARDTLDATLVDATGKPDLWRARLAFAEDADAARAVIDRWALAMPASLLPLEALLSLQQGIGDPAGAVITAERLVSLQPGHVDGRLQIVDGLMAQDPARAIDRLQSWLQSAVEPADRSFLLGMLGLGQDHLGNHDQAVETWSKMHAEIASLRLPLPPLGTPRAEWPELAQHAPGAPQIAFLVGAPGSAVERLAAVMESIGGPFRADRFGLFAPQDDFQSYSLIEGLRSGRIGGEEVIARWRQALPSRRLGTADIIDWLPWWDNALLIALRPHLPEAMLIFAVRDPRDMLLEWMAFGSVSRFQFPSPQKAAEWLANALGQLAALSENDWFPHHIIRTDAVGNDAQAAAARVSEVLATQVPVPASVGPAHFTAGHWRDYSKVMEAPFALLAPVAKRLGYPEN